MKIAVIGANGPTGRELVKQGVQRGHEVTAVVRDPGKAQLESGVRVVRGDATKAESLVAAFSGQDAVLSAVGTSKLFKPTTLFSDSVRGILSAMQQTGVRRFIYLTGIGAGDSRGHGPWYYNGILLPLLLNEIYKDKTRSEESVRASDRQWVIVRPSLLNNKPAQGKLRVATSPNGYKGTHISRADVAAFMLDQVTSDQYLGKAVLISD